MGAIVSTEEKELTTPEETAVSPETELVLLASSWSALSREERKEKFQSLARTDAEELFLSLNTHDQAELFQDFSGSLEKRSWVRLLAPDDVADLIQELGTEFREEVLGLLDPQTRREVTALLAYAEDNAGGLMSSRFARLRPDMTVDEAISYLRLQAKTQVETIYYAYVLSSTQTLLGVVSFRELFSAAPQKNVQDIMQTEVIRIPVDMDQEQIGRIFTQQNLMALPVIDPDGVMKGIVTFDDVATAIQREATEDIQKFGGLESLEAPYFKLSFQEMLRKRGGWLIVLFLGEMLTATAISFYQLEIERAVVLTFFLPLIIASGGNSGSQASTLIIRALALGEVRLKDWWRVFGKEILMGICLGVLLGIVGLLRILFWPSSESLYGPHYVAIGFTVFFTLIFVVAYGTITGSMLPFLLKRFKFDPASASAPFVATLVDVMGLVIYFSIASLILKGSLL
ncbi:MAG: magnesium transporter [Bdellovibrionales bacterium]